MREKTWASLRVVLTCLAVGTSAFAAEPVKTAPGWKHFQQLFASKGTGPLLEKQGFAVDGNAAFNEFFELYEKNRYRPLLVESHDVSVEGDVVTHRTFVKSIPSVVTPDLVLHNLHLFFDFSLARAEETRFQPELLALVKELLAETRAQGTALVGTPWAAAARDNLAYLAVARALLESGDLPLPASTTDGPGVSTDEQVAQLKAKTLASQELLLGKELPSEVRALAKQELGRVVEGTQRVKPLLFDYPATFKEDYSQYTVRGHYVKSPRLQAYFRATMWLSRVLLSFQSDSAIRSAALFGLAVNKGESLKRWQRIFEAVTFLVGRPDDITFVEVLPLLAEAYPKGERLADAAAFAALKGKLAQLRAPEVQGILTLRDSGPSLASTKGFHFFSQRTVVDAVIFQGLVDPQVPGRSEVFALEVPDVLGSSLAAKILAKETLGKTFPGYAAQRALLQSKMPARLDAEKSAQFYAGWLYALAPLLAPVAEGYPAFMRSEAYPVLRLNTYMASYAQLKHDTVLYAKQAAAEMGGPGFEDVELALDDRGYVIPEVDLYARTGLLLRALRTGLSGRQLFPEQVSQSYGRFEALVGKLEAISRKELAGAALSAEDYQLIKFIGGDLEHFWEETLFAKNGRARWQLLEENNSQLIADIFTGAGGIKHVASGFVQPVYVAFPRDGKVAVGRGGVLTFHELVSGERLSDAAWQRLLREKPPAPPAWFGPAVSRDPNAPLSRFDSMAGE